MRERFTALHFALGTAAFVGFLAATLYFYRFGNLGLSFLSDDHERWGQFSDFFNLFVSLANLIVLATLAHQIHRNEQKRDDQRKENEQVREQERKQYEQWIERPVLIFKKNPDELNCRITNVGRGAAININMDSLLEDEVLRPGEFFTCLIPQTLEVRYNDVFNNMHISSFELGRTRFSFYVFAEQEKSKTVYKKRY